MENFDYNYFTAMNNNFTTGFNEAKMTSEDLERAMFIKNIIENLSVEGKNSRRFIKNDILIEEALKNWLNIGFVTTFESIFQKLKTISWVVDKHFDTCSFSVLSLKIKTGTETALNAVSILYPAKVDETSKVFLNHEMAHILKERNSEEIVNYYTTAETIPLSIELISAVQSENASIARDVLRKRFIMLKNHLPLYNFVTLELLIEKDEFKRTALNTALKKLNCYFLSFYYALVLFSLYLDSPNRIVDLINFVLECNLTTDAMLGLLDESKFDSWANEGLEEFKKILC